MKKPKKPDQVKPDPAKTPCVSPADLLDEMDAAMRPTSEKISEVDEFDLPEGTITPDKETEGLIADVIAAADEFRPMHQKLKTVVDKHRTKIVLLKHKFGVRMGCGGYRIVVGGKALLWEQFISHYFGVTARRLNQLLDVKDEKNALMTVVKTPDEDKYLYKRGFEAAKKMSEDALLAANEKLAALGATPEAQKLAEKVVVLEALLEEREVDARKRIEQLQRQNERLLLHPEMSISEALAMQAREREALAMQDPEPQPPATKPTVADWRKHQYSVGRFKLKYFEDAARYFSDRYQHAFQSTPFRKALEQVGSPKHTGDLRTLAAMLRGAVEDLKMLAEAVEPPGAKNPEQGDAVSEKVESDS